MFQDTNLTVTSPKKVFCITVHVRVAGANLEPRWDLSDQNKLIINDVCKSCEGRPNGDLMVIQCNASNQHGYVVSQGYLNVLGKIT